MNNEREELADMAYRGNYNDRNSPGIQPLAERSDNERSRMYATADAVLASGYRKPKILGYAVVDERDTPLMVNFAARKAAEEYALENTGRMNHQYRVAEIVEPRA